MERVNNIHENTDVKVHDEKQILVEMIIDLFYSESNIRHLENIVRDIKDGKAHFEEHELIEVDE